MQRLLRTFAILLCMIGTAAVLATWMRPTSLRESGPPIATSRSDQFLTAVTDINQAVLSEWENRELSPAADAPWELIARRMALGLAGTTPSLEELRWLDGLPEGGRIANYADYLLADRRTADYLAERMARGLVGTDESPFLLFRRRRFVSWLSDQLYSGIAYDAIIRNLIDSEGVWTTNPPVNFITSTVQDETGQPDVDQLAVRTSRFVLGVRLDCAQCHDHPFDERWKQEDFAQLAAFYGNTGFIEDEPLRGVRDDAQQSEVDPAAPFYPDLCPTDGRPRERLAKWATHPNNRAFARATANRFWALLFGRPIVEPIDDIPPDGAAPPLLDALADRFIQSGYEWRELVRMIVASRPFQLSSGGPAVTARHANYWAAFPITRLRPEQAAGALVQASRLGTIDSDSHLVLKLVRFGNEQDFLNRYGDAGEDEMTPRPGTTPQRLLLLNGQVAHERTEPDFVFNAAGRLPIVTESNETAIETAYLATLSRRPTPVELQHFIGQLNQKTGEPLNEAISDMCWALVNSTEFTWNH